LQYTDWVWSYNMRLDMDSRCDLCWITMRCWVGLSDYHNYNDHNQHNNYICTDRSMLCVW
jgi:hypothetical protein